MNYLSLKASVNDWLARSDISGEAIVDDLIDLAEARINRLLRLRAMEKPYSQDIVSTVTSVPVDFIEFKHAFLYKGAGDSFAGVGVIDPSANVIEKLEYRSSDAMSGEIKNSSGLPCFFTRIGDKFYYWPQPADNQYSVGGIYYAAFTALSDANTTNWLSDNAPDLLLSAVLREASAYIKSPDQEAYWSNRRDQAMTELQDADDRAEFSATPLTQRVVGAAP